MLSINEREEAFDVDQSDIVRASSCFFQGRPLELRILKSQHSPQETLRMRMHP